MMRVLLILVIVSFFFSCNGPEQKSIFEDLTVQELNRLISIDSIYETIYEDIKFYNLKSSKLDSAKYLNITYKQYYDFLGFTKQFETRIDSLIDYWNLFIKNYKEPNLNKLVRIYPIGKKYKGAYNYVVENVSNIKIAHIMFEYRTNTRLDNDDLYFYTVNMLREKKDIYEWETRGVHFLVGASMGGPLNPGEKAFIPDRFNKDKLNDINENDYREGKLNYRVFFVNEILEDYSTRGIKAEPLYEEIPYLIKTFWGLNRMQSNLLFSNGEDIRHHRTTQKIVFYKMANSLPENLNYENMEELQLNSKNSSQNLRTNFPLIYDYLNRVAISSALYEFRQGLKDIR